MNFWSCYFNGRVTHVYNKRDDYNVQNCHPYKYFLNCYENAEEGVIDRSLTLFPQKICNTNDRESLVESPTRKTVTLIQTNLIHSLSKYLWSTYHVLLGSWDTSINKREEGSCPYILAKKTGNDQ